MDTKLVLTVAIVMTALIFGLVWILWLDPEGPDVDMSDARLGEQFKRDR